MRHPGDPAGPVEALAALEALAAVESLSTDGVLTWLQEGAVAPPERED